MVNRILQPVLERLPENNRVERIWKIAQTDFKKRYFNAKLGLIWAFINPIFRLFIYLFVFKLIGRMGGGVENFGLYIFSGLIMWMTFSECTNKSLLVFKQKKYLLENIRFNKIDLFISNTLAVFIGLCFNTAAYILISLLMGIPLYFEIIWLPFIMLNMFILCLGVSMILATITIYLKDLVHIWTMAILLGFWTIPAIFPLENFVGNLRALLYINPVGGLIINFRNAVLYGQPMDYVFLIHCAVYALVLFFIGRYLLQRHWQNALEYN